MEAINLWWAGLNALTQGFFIAAAFFSVFFLWQLIMAIAGLGGGDMDMDSGPNWEHQSPVDAHNSLLAFKLLSVRSILAFATLFTWAGALYLMQGAGVGRALFLALLWGVAAMALVWTCPFSFCKPSYVIPSWRQ